MKKGQYSFNEALDKSIELLKNGRLYEEIFSHFPQYKEKLQEILPLVDILCIEREKITPPTEGFRHLLDKIEEEKDNVTRDNFNRYIVSMSKKVIAIGALAVLVLVIGSYLLLSRENNPSSQTSIPTRQPLTAQNADSSLEQTELNLQTQMDQIDQDMNSIDQINTQSASEEDVSSINSL